MAAEANVANMLLLFRKIFRFKYRIVFCDGEPVGHKIADNFDVIVFLHQEAFSDAVSAGIPPTKYFVRPHLVLTPSITSKKLARAFLDLDGHRLAIIV